MLYEVSEYKIENENGKIIGRFGKFKIAKELADLVPVGYEREVYGNDFKKCQVLVYKKRNTG